MQYHFVIIFLSLLSFWHYCLFIVVALHFIIVTLVFVIFTLYIDHFLHDQCQNKSSFLSNIFKRWIQKVGLFLSGIVTLHNTYWASFQVQGHMCDVALHKLCTLLYYYCPIIEDVSWVSLFTYFFSARRVYSYYYPWLVSTRIGVCLWH